MSRTTTGIATAASLIGALLVSQAHAESGASADAEIALLKQLL